MLCYAKFILDNVCCKRCYVARCSYVNLQRNVMIAPSSSDPLSLGPPQSRLDSIAPHLGRRRCEVRVADSEGVALGHVQGLDRVLRRMHSATRCRTAQHGRSTTSYHDATRHDTAGLRGRGSHERIALWRPPGRGRVLLTAVRGSSWSGRI